jgi:hypothetical protein
MQKSSYINYELDSIEPEKAILYPDLGKKYIAN